MIFVTVGTHEQPFDRLLKSVDSLIEKGVIKEQVIVQYGYSNYKIRLCEGEQFYTFEQMEELVKSARIVITHGGPSSFVMPLQCDKIPIVVPRQKKYGEHVNNHQVDFCKAVAEGKKNIILVNSEEGLEKAISKYEKIMKQISVTIVGNTDEFCKRFEHEISSLFD